MLMNNAMIETMDRNSRQQGFVAIFSVMIIMGILTLLMIGFSNITRQAQRRALDDQLTTQAFYAAETGINRALALKDAGTLVDKTLCDNNNGTYDYTIDSATEVSISCLLIDTTPTSVASSSVPVIGTGEPFSSYFRSNSGGPIRRLVISWDSPSSGAAFRSTGLSGSNVVLPPASGWDSGGIETVGVLRIELVPGNSLNRNASVGNSYTFFLYPSTDSSADATLTVSTGTGSQGVAELVRCNATPNAAGARCWTTVTLDGTPSIAYYLRAVSYYNATQIDVAPLNAANAPLEVRDSQALIDSTGRASDVSRRLQVRVSLHDNPGYHEPFSILSAHSLCKRFVAIPSANGGSINNNPPNLSSGEQAVCNIGAP